MSNAGEMRFASDRPKSCEYCYWWQGRKKGCQLGGENECYYRLSDKPDPKRMSECDGCPYGRVSPCIGFCIKKLREEQKEAWKTRK